MKHRLLGLLAVLASVVLSTQVASAACEKIETIVIGTWPAQLSAIPLFFAHEKGFDKQECLDIEVRQFLGLNPQVVAFEQPVSAGGVDLLMEPQLLQYLWARGKDPVLVMNVGKQETYGLVGPKGASLIGATIAAGACAADTKMTGSTNPILIEYLHRKYPKVRITCEESGHKFTVAGPEEASQSIDIVPRGFSSARYACLKSKDCKFAMFYSPQEYAAEKELGLEIIAHQADFMPDLGLSIFGSRSRVEALSKSGVLGRLKKALTSASKELVGNPKEGQEWLRSFLETQKGGTAKMVLIAPEHLGDYYAFGASHVWNVNGCFSAKALDDYDRFMARQGLVDQSPNAPTLKTKSILAASACIN